MGQDVEDIVRLISIVVGYGMQLRQLEYFVAVAEEANFTRAAARVHVSQSGISAQIRQLENDLGAPLFDRSTRVAALTVAGEAALAHARAALAAARAVRDAVDDVNQLVRGRLEVGMVTACTVTPLFDALSSFHRAHPGIDVSLREDNSDRLVDDVRAGAVDLALVTLVNRMLAKDRHGRPTAEDNWHETTGLARWDGDRLVPDDTGVFSDVFVRDRQTAVTYREHLERLYLLDPLPAWIPSFSPLRRLTHTPKHHLVDPALAARLVGVQAEGLLRGEGVRVRDRDDRARLRRAADSSLPDR